MSHGQFNSLLQLIAFRMQHVSKLNKVLALNVTQRLHIPPRTCAMAYTMPRSKYGSNLASKPGSMQMP
eukprot:m.825350 g.825350  ORF g.825350 m.825350 type:complete len:68 (+) comp23406_c0_seq46:232-435(+)